jgi:tRNA pseudouridine55 synthase
MPPFETSAINGVLVVDKPKGITSRSVTTRIRRLLDVEKSGHLGTLDPLATGVLPVMLGKATRLARFLEKGEKEYLADIRLGVTTTTLDAEGEVVEERDVSVTEEQIISAVKTLIGEVEQRVPKFSAAKHRGKPLYKYARAGEDVSTPMKRITIHEMRVEEIDLPEVRIFVRSSPGTYIRTIAAELGGRLGCGACLSALRRIRSGEFNIEQAVTMEDLTRDQALQAMIPLQSLLSSCPQITLTEDQAMRMRDGKRIPADEFKDFKIETGQKYKLTGEDIIVIADCINKGGKIELKPVRVIKTD